MFIEQAKVEDAEEILKLQKLAYQSEAEIHNDNSIPPLTQSVSEIKAEFENQIFLKASVDDGRIIGSVRAYVSQGTCFICRLIVHPDFQNQGIGTSLMHEIERRFGQAKRFELFTGHLSKRNLYLYQKLGYLTFNREKVNENLELVYMEKTNEKM
ncbi:MAG: GNAT family N-acetyltransferase [Planctomycetes bacterium]|nr:GNAT family N-acetyltransferase [Planctomycetota bacterium]